MGLCREEVALHAGRAALDGGVSVVLLLLPLPFLRWESSSLASCTVWDSLLLSVCRSHGHSSYNSLR